MKKEKHSGLTCILASNITEVRKLMSEGFCPVKCRIDGESVVDALEMDQQVGFRGYKHYAARARDPRFVVTGKGEAEVCFCIASLAGLIPHPSLEKTFASMPRKQAIMCRDWLPLATTLDKVHIASNEVDIQGLPESRMLLMWRGVTTFTHDSIGLLTGVGNWRNILCGTPADWEPLLKTCARTERARVINAGKDLARAEKIGEVLLLKHPVAARGFGLWYGREKSGKPDTRAGWTHPVVAVYSVGSNVTMRCPNKAVAEALFGEGGLMKVFTKLKRIVPGKWRGHETVSASPHGVEVTIEQARAVARFVNKQVSSA